MRNNASRIALAAVMAMGVATALAAPAFADVDVTVTVNKTKTVTVTELITKTKTVDLHVSTTELAGDGAAEAQALANISNLDQHVTLIDVDYDADLDLSINDNSGITQVSQAAGNVQNQGNIVSAAVSATGNSFADAQAEVDQLNGDTILDRGIGTIDAEGSVFISSMLNSVEDNSGITQVNQDSGNSNNQTNAVAVAAGVNASTEAGVLVALSEAALGQEISNADVLAFNNISSARIDSSITGNDGVTHVNQSTGNYANQSNVVAVGAAVAF